MSFELVETIVAPILEILKTKQDAAFAKNGKFAQLYASHDVIPTISTAPNAKVDMVRDEDIYPGLPAEMSFALRVDEYNGKEQGWVLWVWVGDYVKTWPFGPDASHFSSSWELVKVWID